MSYTSTDSILLSVFNQLDFVSNSIQDKDKTLTPFAESLGPNGVVQRQIQQAIYFCKEEAKLKVISDIQSALISLFIKFLRENPNESVSSCHSFFQFIMKFDFYDPNALVELEEYRNQFDKDIEPEGETPIYNEEFLYEQNSNEAAIEENVCW